MGAGDSDDLYDFGDSEERGFDHEETDDYYPEDENDAEIEDEASEERGFDHEEEIYSEDETEDEEEASEERNLDHSESESDYDSTGEFIERATEPLPTGQSVNPSVQPDVHPHYTFNNGGLMGRSYYPYPNAFLG